MKYPDTNAFGDNDPIDAIEISNKVYDIGAIVQLKVLGVYAMLDEGETDWKIVGINTNDELADKLNGISFFDKNLISRCI